MVSVAILIVSSRAIFVNKLVTSKDIKNLSYVLSCLSFHSLREYVVKVKNQDIERIVIIRI